ncbi:MAG: transcription factor FapR [Limnochordia bacterium]|nr:transcription factor FapR [Limnochordia bacterium]
MAMKKAERQRCLQQVFAEEVFVTDEELAKRFGVSVQTIRLDRLQLGVPELRVRIKELAEGAFRNLKALTTSEFIGQPVEIELGKRGKSILETTWEMGLERTGIVRGHHIFAQANSLAVALIDAPVALTGSAVVRFCLPVNVGDKIMANAHVKSSDGRRALVGVESFVREKKVFEGDFVMFARTLS